MYHRLCTPSFSYSFFLFGARSTGKTTLLKTLSKSLKNKSILWIDLLDPETEKELSLYPSRLIEKIEAVSPKPKLVIIDEIQKIPKLLDVVHKLIESQKICFALTGSSARKLKREHSNLLAGRAFKYDLHPLTFIELGSNFKLIEAMEWGTLPQIYHFTSRTDKERYLHAYVQTYIKEEIRVEQIVRNIEPFRSFLEVAAQCNGTIINYSKLAREAQIDTKNVQRYFEILQDTLLGFMLEAYHKSIRKRQVHHPKFYFFDIGVTRAIAGQLDHKPVPHTHAFGNSFEHLVILEIIRINDYTESHYRLSYLRTGEGVEIDLILEKGDNVILVEIKSSDNIISDHLQALKTLGNEFPGSIKYLLCLEKKARIHEGIRITPWQEGIRKIFFKK